MGRRGPKVQTKEARQRISDSLHSSTSFRDAMKKRAGKPRAHDSIEVRAKKAAARFSPEGTDRYRFEYELALQRISLIENQERRRAAFVEQSTREGE